MTRFGRYVTVHELRRTGLTVVYSGRDEKSPDEKFAIKVLEPSALFADKEHEKAGANQFLNSARLQQKVVAGGSQHWAHIHEYGLTPGGTFYIADKYDRSLQELIDGHVGLGAKGLHAIIEPIAEGLIELKKAYKRPHGNLKATNVLITGDSSEMKVALSDPLPDESIDAKIHWHDDLRAIGELIYQLVVHRPAPSLDSARIPDSKEWARLKRQAGAWRDLCVRLLAVRIRPEAISLESLVEELTELGKSKPVFSRLRLAVLSLLFLIAIAIVIIFVPWSLSVSLEDREDLLKEYFSWIKPLYHNLEFSFYEDDYNNSIKNGPAKKWKDRDPDLVKIIGKERDDENSKIWIAGYPAQTAIKDDDIINEIRDLSTDPKEAIGAVEYLRRFFDSNTTKASELWPMLVTIHEAAIQFEQEKWLKPAASYLNYLVDKVKPPNKQDYEGEVPNISPKKEKIYEGVNEILDVNEILELREKDIGKIQEEIDSLRKDVVQYKNGKRTKVDEELSVIAQTMIRTPEEFDSYLNKIQGFRNIENIHDEYEKKWGQKYTHASCIVENLKLMPKNTENADKFGSTLKDLETNFNKLKQNLEKEGVYYVAKNEDKIKERYEDLMDNLQNLWDGIVEDLNDPSDWLEAVARREIASSDVLEDKWQKRRQKLLDDDTRKKLESDDRERYLTYTAVQPKVEYSWDRLNKLQKLGANLFQDLEEQLRPFNEKTMPINELTTGYRNALEEAFLEIEYTELFDINSSHPIPDINEPGSFEYFSGHKLAQLVKGSSATNLVDLVSAYSDIREQFRLFYLLEDKTTEKCVNIFENRLKKLKDDKVFSKIFDSDSNVGEAFSILESKIDKIRNITNMQLSGLRSQAEKIIEKPWDQDYETLYAVYVRLEKPSGDPKWPKDHNEWKLDQKMKNSLREKISAIQDKVDRAKTLKDDLDDIFAKRKEHFEKLKPPYCERLDHYRQNDRNILVFAEGIALRDKFEPVMDASGNAAVVSAWDEIRQAVNEQGKWIDFFHTTDISDSKNVGWPKYIQSTKDRSVILRFIPAGNGNPEPFYMAIHEITNAQYEIFLSDINANEVSRTYKDSSDKSLLIWSRNKPPYGLYWGRNRNPQLKHYPVTYVTYHGTESYVKWLGAQLPTVSQHKYSSGADTDNKYRWGSDLAGVSLPGHVRGAAWQEEAKNYNRRKNSMVPPLPVAPVGAVNDLTDDSLDTSKVVHGQTIYDSFGEPAVWPIVSTTRSDNLDLYDMIGNVWEWCQGESICGGSCLAPPDYIPGSESYVSKNYSTKFDRQSAHDVGFRVTVPAK